MFSIEQISASGFDTIILADTISGTSVEVIPACGAILHAFNILHNGGLLNVIDNYESADDFKSNVAAKGFKSCKLSPFACRVKNACYSFGGEQYRIKKFLLGENALHGLIYDGIYDLIRSEANDMQAAVSLQYKYMGSDEGFPFRYTCIVTYVLKTGNELTISTDIINSEEGLMPLQDGWHPYFTFGGKIDELQLEFQSKEKMVFDKMMIPTGEKIPYREFGSLEKIGDTKFDDCFTLNFAAPIAIGSQPMCVLRDKEKKLQVEIVPDKSYPYLQIYTPDHRNSIAIENLSAPPDTFNNGIDLKVLEPNEKANFTTVYKITPLT